MQAAAVAACNTLARVLGMAALHLAVGRVSKVKDGVDLDMLPEGWPPPDACMVHRIQQHAVVLLVAENFQVVYSQTWWCMVDTPELVDALRSTRKALVTCRVARQPCSMSRCGTDGRKPRCHPWKP